jgi:hypothetical protein
MASKAVLILSNLLAKLHSSLRRFPIAISLATCIVMISIGLNHWDIESRDVLDRVLMSLALGIPLALSFRVWFERIPHLHWIIKLVFYLTALAGLVLYFEYGLKDIRPGSIIRYISYNIALYLAFIFIPYFYKKENFELYAVQLFTKFSITYLYSGVLYLGLAAMLFTIGKLFSFESGSDYYKLYYDFWLIVAGIFAPVYFLAVVPGPQQEITVESYPKILRVLLLYIVIPLLVVYSVILYVYFGKIIISWEWPVGILVNLVLWYSIIATLVIFAIYPLYKVNQWLPKFLSLFPKLILPLLTMMFVTMGIRIQAYGITESRYFVLVAGLWVTGCMIYFIFNRNARNIILPVSIAIIAVLSVSGPWSCYSVSKASQNLRLEKILKKAGMIHNGSITKPDHGLPESTKREIRSILSYFRSYHSFRAVKCLPRDFEADQMMKVFGFKLFNKGAGGDSDETPMNYFLVDDTRLFNIQGFDYFVSVSNTNGYRKDKSSAEPAEVLYSHEDHYLTITMEGKEVYHKSIKDLTLKLYKEYRQVTPTSKKDITYLDQNDKIKVLYIFKQISGTFDKVSGEVSLDSVSFNLFIKKN